MYTTEDRHRRTRGFVVTQGNFVVDGRRSTAPDYRENDLWVYFRGFIANRKELIDRATRLRMPGADTDSALIAVAYRLWGHDLQAHILGEYALVVADGIRGTLFATHDGLGIVPLFYTQISYGVVVAANLEDLIRQNFSLKLDDVFIAQYLASGEARMDRTPYEGVSRLLPGRSLECKGGSMRELETWNLGAEPPLVFPDEREYEERFRELLAEGVRTAVPSGSSAWTELSGGMDSSTVACMASLCEIPGLAALSVIFSSTTRANESEWMRAVLEEYPMPWHVIDGNAAPPYSELPEYFCPEPAPLHCESAAFRRRNELLAAHRIDLLLTGLGGDEVFFGYSMAPLYMADLLQHGRLLSLFNEARRWSLADRTRRAPLYWISRYAMTPVVRRTLRRPTALAPDVAAPPWLTPSVLAHARAAESSSRPIFHTRGVARQGFADAMLSNVRAAQGIASMAHQFAYRHPLLYRPLVEFMASIPHAEQQRPGQSRPLQRRALVGIIPEVIRTRIGKVTWDEPRHVALSRNPAWVQLLTEESRLVERGLVDAAAWQNGVARARLGQNFAPLLFDAAASLEIWLRQLDERPSRAV